MIIDSRLEFSDAQALTASAASTSVVNLGSDRDVGVGEPLWVVYSLDAAATNADADETYSLAIQTDSVENFATPTTLTTHTIAAGTAAGYINAINLPMANEQYLRLYYTLGGTTPTVTISAHLSSQHPPIMRQYDDSI